ncbi:MAG: 3'(2'),5'-bisphosphate nucleotidase [Phycisphaeraceae bacterium]
MPYDLESQTALAAVRQAAAVCQAVQQRLVRPETLAKKDKSPVTVADFASQAVVCAALEKAFPDDPVVGEEDAHELRQSDQAALRNIVVDHVRNDLGAHIDDDQVLGWIDRGGASGGASAERCWTLDPIDGTKGFLRGRGDQYAIALALLERGQVVLGVLGCPNLPFPNANGQTIGTLMIAVRGQGVQMQPLLAQAPPPGVVRAELQAHVDQLSDPADPAARFCESVESGHSDQSASATLAALLGITHEPLRMDSQAKYAAVARGDASIYLRLPVSAKYREKIWDHAAGAIIVAEAGGRVTDVHGQPLDFSIGRTLANNQGIIATNSALHHRVVAAVAAAALKK